MRTFIEGSASRYESRPMTRRDLFRSSLSGLAALALAPSRVMGQSQNAVLPVPVTSWSHPSFHPQYLNLKWYQRVFGLPIMYHQVHQGSPRGPWADGPNVKVGDGPAYLWFRPDTAMAARQHWSIGVKDWNLDRLLRAMVEMGLTGGASPKNTEGGGNPELNTQDPDGNGVQFQSDTSCGGSGYLGELCDFSATAIRIPGDPPPIEVATLHHMKYVVSNLPRSLAWYQKLTDMKLVTYQELGPRTAGYEGAPVAILQVGAGPQYFAMTEGTNGDPGSHARPHVGFGIKGFDADQIMKRLAEHDVPARLRVREGVTPEILLTDPEGNVELQLNDVNNRGGGGVLGDVIDPRLRPFPGSARSL